MELFESFMELNHQHIQLAAVKGVIHLRSPPSAMFF